MGNRYSKEELARIEPLILEGLTNREIASRPGRSEAGLRNVRYRLKLKRKTTNSIRHLQRQREKIESEIEELAPQISTYIGLVTNVEFYEWEWDDRHLIIFQPVLLYEESHIQGRILRIPRIRTIFSHEEVILYSHYTGFINEPFICARFVRPRIPPPGS